MRHGKSARQASLRHPSLLALLALATSVIVTVVQAQNPDTTIRARTNVVLVPTLVKDSQGGVVYNLDARNFVIEDDGVEQAVHLDQTPEAQPVSLVIAIEKGRRANYEFDRMKGLTAMISPLFENGKTRVAVVEFDTYTKLAQNFTTDESLIDDTLSNLKPGDNGAAILDAIDYSVDLLKKESDGRERVLLLISEAHDHGSAHKISETVVAIGQSNALMYALAFSPGKSNILDTLEGKNVGEMHPGINFLDLGYRAGQAMRKNVPSTVVAMTGGEYELFAGKNKFDMSLTSFTNHLHSRYLLSFAPKEPHPGLHQIRVRLKDAPNDTAVARTSYWADSP